MFDVFDVVNLYLCAHSFSAVFVTDVLFALAFGAVTIGKITPDLFALLMDTLQFSGTFVIT